MSGYPTCSGGPGAARESDRLELEGFRIEGDGIGKTGLHAFFIDDIAYATGHFGVEDRHNELHRIEGVISICDNSCILDYQSEGSGHDAWAVLFDHQSYFPVAWRCRFELESGRERFELKSRPDSKNSTILRATRVIR